MSARTDLCRGLSAMVVPTATSANTAIFTLVQGILLRSLPVNDPSRLYRIGDKNDCCYYNNYQNDNGDFDLFSYDLYLHLKQAAPEFEQLAAVEAGGNGFSVRQGAAPARPMRSEYVSGNYFFYPRRGRICGASSQRKRRHTRSGTHTGVELQDMAS